jgi:hypothetical protein
MKVHALVPALVLAAALAAPPLADAGNRHRPDRGRRPAAHGYYNHRPSYGYYGYRSHRGARPYYRPYSRQYYSAPYGYYDDGSGYGYGYYPPPPPPRYYYRPRPRIGIWFRF